MGVLSPDERALYFVSDADGTLDIMRQSPIQSGPTSVSAGFGDAAWPELSPRGDYIAYISFERDATGDVCIRGVGERAGEDERCWPQTGSAELVVLWWDASSLAVLSRQSLHGDYQLVLQPIAEGEPPRPLLARNMVGLALSPDRRWLAYVPLDKTTREVGITFSQRTAVGIGLQRFEPPAARREKVATARATAEPPLLYVPRLPGVTGSVTFSAGGEHLLFTQFLNDTNRDGIIDGDDNAVVFRVPFHAAAREPIAASLEPEQLTSGRWDCHYPAPASRALIVSCSHGGSLDVYSLPLDGAVPPVWDDARVAGEIAVARDLWTKLLLYSRRLGLAKDDGARQRLVREMMALHLELGEYESAIHYAEQRLVGTEGERWGHIIAELARHRREDLALVRGQTSSAYVERESARARALSDGLASAPAPLAALGRLVISEIEDDIGEKSAALATFRQIDLAHMDEPLLAPLVARRAERLYRLRADRASLLDVYQTLAHLPALSVAERLEQAQRFTHELARGRTREARGEALRAARATAPDTSELALLLDVERALLRLDDATEEPVRAELFELYEDNRDPDRRRALVLSTLRAAARAGSEMLQYQFVNSWASSLERSAPERKNGEKLYELIVLDRGYGEGRKAALDESRGYFYAAALATDSLEAHIGFIEASMNGGLADAPRALDRAYAKRFADDPDNPVYAFVRAYRLARELPRETDAASHEQHATEVVELLAEVDDQLPKQSQVHQLWGFALHQRARRTGSAEAAADANRHYELALDLAQDDERLTATLLHRLGLLNAAIGNHGAALRHFEERDQLPHIRPLEELGLRLATAASARHMGDGELAKTQMLAASELLAAQPSLSRFEPLVLDRLALSLSVAGDTDGARARYAALDAVLGRPPGTRPVNQLKAKVGLAASSVESDPRRTLQVLDEADRLLEAHDDLYPEPEVVWRRPLVGDYDYTPLQYRALIAGLRSRAALATGDEPGALGAMRQRVALLEERLEDTGADEDRTELALAHRELARIEQRSSNPTAAARALERALELSDEFDTNTGSEVTEVGLLLRRNYAELYLYGNVQRDTLRRDVRAELWQGYEKICKYRSPRWSRQRFLFKTYLAEVELEQPVELERGARQ
jgi:hypothetical protein